MRRFELKILWVFLFVGCANFSKARLSNLSAIKVGQAPAETTAALGQPSEKIKKGEAETWYYEIYSDDSSRTYPYKAVFQSGKLKSFEADYSRSAKNRELCRERKRSDQRFVQIHGVNNAGEVKVDCAD